MKSKIFGMAIGAMLAMTGLAGAAHAAVQITVDSTSPTWNNVVGGSNINSNTSGSGNNAITQIFWGAPAGFDGQSGLGFNPAQPPSFQATPGVAFDLGTLWHYNQPIQGGTAASSVNLSLSTSVHNVAAAQVFGFKFLIDETPNVAPCAYPGGSPCADKISFENLTTTSSFTLNGLQYTLEILGFSGDGGSTIQNSFISNEGGNNSTHLYAQFVAPHSAVPEPGPLALMGTGLVALGMLGTLSTKRRRDDGGNAAA